MSTPNPLAPQGSLLEQQAKGRSTFQVISFIGAVHVVVLCGILWTACSRDDKAKTEAASTIGQDPYSTAAATTPPDGAIPPGQSNLAAVPNIPPPGLPANSPAPVANGAGTPAPGTVAVPALGQNTPAPGGPTLNVAPPALPPGNVGAPGTTPPPSLPDTTTAPTGAAGEYKVAKGDLGTTIAKKNGVSLKALVAANPTVNWSRLRIGQVIQIPAGSTPPATKGTTPAAATTDTAANAGPTSNYTVRPGDTGTKIATKHNVKWAAIRKANNLKSDSLHPGQVLVIPGRAASATGNEPAAGAATPSAAPVAPIAIPLPPASAPGPAPR